MFLKVAVNDLHHMQSHCLEMLVLLVDMTNYELICSYLLYRGYGGVMCLEFHVALVKHNKHMAIMFVLTSLKYYEPGLCCTEFPDIAVTAVACCIVCSFSVLDLRGQ